MSTIALNCKDDLNRFDIGDSGAQLGMWNDHDAVYLTGFHTTPILLRDPIGYDCFRLQAEIAVPQPEAFIGLVFGARDLENYELVYLSPDQATESGEIQYDPIMNGSSTWQIYNGPTYQAYAPFPVGKWTKFALGVSPHSVSVFVGDESAPKLVISTLKHGQVQGRVGFWGNLAGYIRNFHVESIPPETMSRKQVAYQQVPMDAFITEWYVSKPYITENPAQELSSWKKVYVEENGCLNINRIYSAKEKGATVQARSVISILEETETVLSFGFSDQIRLWLNDEEIYQGKTVWDPPHSDGRIRSDHMAIPVKWRAGVNTVRAEVTNLECMFGWGLTVHTGLYNVKFLEL